MNALLETRRQSQLYADITSSFLLERVTIDLHHGFDKNAQALLGEASQLRGFHYVLTGRLGKRTRYQERDISQLVVLAKSCYESAGSLDAKPSKNGEVARPDTVDLNDDTLLEAISFTSKPVAHLMLYKRTKFQ